MTDTIAALIEKYQRDLDAIDPSLDCEWAARCRALLSALAAEADRATVAALPCGYVFPTTGAMCGKGPDAPVHHDGFTGTTNTITLHDYQPTERRRGPADRRAALAAEADRATPKPPIETPLDEALAALRAQAHRYLDLDSPEAATPTALDVLLIAGAPLLRDAYAAYIVRGWLHSPEAAERLATYLAVEFGKAGFYRPGVSMEFLTQQARLILADVLAALREQGR